ncbi:MAG: hypothetical protein FJ257_02735 [Phycisphaerae bacterium]|nr:hypothetical protein [Phycisphaerae bacterium]
MPTSLLILAQNDAANDTEDVIRQVDLLSRPDELLNQLVELPAIAGVLVMIVGLICVLRGYQWHRWIVIVLALMLGLAVGRIMSHEMGRSTVVAVAMGLLFAAIASPLLRFTVAVFAGLSGAFLGANVWAIVQGPDSANGWAGAAMGFILLALSSFLLFRLSIILFTALGGGAMLVLGGIACLLHVDSIQQSVSDHLAQHQLIVPLLVGVTTVAGFVLQENRTRGGSTEDAG